MANVGHGTARQIIDSDGDVVGVTGNALDVHLKTGVGTIDIGDVSLLLDGTAADYGTGNVNTSGRTLRVTLASNDVHFGAVGASADADGALHAQLMFANDRLQCIDTEITSADTNLGYLVSTIHTEDASHTSADGGYMSLAVRNDSLASLVSHDGDYSPFQVNASGALYVEVASSNLGKAEDASHSSGDVGVMALAVRQDTAGSFGATGDYTPLQVNSTGYLRVSATAVGASEALNIAGVARQASQYGTVPLVVRNDVLAISHAGHIDGDYTFFQVDAQGALYTTHGITGGGQGVKVTTGAGDHIVLGGDVACKKIDIQAQTDNTGLIAVGFNNVDVTEANGDGIILYAGDTYSLEVNNLNLIYIDSTVTGDGVRYTYFT